MVCLPRIIAAAGSINNLNSVNSMGSVGGVIDTVLVETLSTIITSSFRLCLFIDKFTEAVTPDPTMVLCQRFLQSLKKLAGASGSRGLRDSRDAKDVSSSSASSSIAGGLLKALQASQAFTSQFTFAI
jgi:hypothetical protein